MRRGNKPVKIFKTKFLINGWRADSAMRLSAFNKVKVHHIAKAQFAVEALVVVEVLDVE